MPTRKRAVTEDDIEVPAPGAEIEKLQQAVVAQNYELATQHETLVSALEQVDKLTNELDMIDAVLRQHEQRLQRYEHGSIFGRLQQVLSHYEEGTARTIAHVEQFKTDLMVQLRAWSLIVNMAGNAATHNEKNARLRGMSELLESAIGTLRDMSFESEVHAWQFDDLFRSTFSSRVYVQRIHELEAEVKLLKEPLHG